MRRLRHLLPPLVALLILTVATAPTMAIDSCQRPILWKIFHPFQQLPPCPAPEPPGPGPQPTPPEPIPPVPPVPPIPPPTPVAGFRVLIVHDVTKDTPAVANEVASAPLHKYLATKCVEYRILDQATNMANDNQIFQDAMKRPRASLPWLWMSDGSKVVEQALPATVADVVKLVDSYTPAPPPTPVPPTPPAPVPPTPPKSTAPQTQRMLVQVCDQNGCRMEWRDVPVTESAQQPESFPAPQVYFPVPQQPVRDVLRGLIIFRMIRRMH